MTRAAGLLVRLRYPILIVWLVAAAAATALLPTIRQAQAGALGDLVPNEARALDAELRSAELFRFPLLSRTLVVQRDEDGLSAAEQARAVRRTVALNTGDLPGLEPVAGALVVTNALGKPPFSRESSTTAITYLFFAPEVDQDERTDVARRLVRRIEADGFIGYTGAVSARAEQADEIAEALPLVELGTVVLVLLVVGLHFRALGAPLVTLLAVGVAYLTSVRLIAVVGKAAGVSVPSEVEPVIVVLLFGVVTDYSIFFLSRLRRCLGEGLPAKEAAIRSTREILPIVLAAGLTVVAASASLLVAKLGFLQAFGPGLAMALLIGLAVSVTFIPAALAVGGAALFWPRRAGLSAASADRPGAGRGGGRRRRARAVELATGRPWLVAGGCVLILGAGASGLARLELGNPLIRGLPAESPPRLAYEQAGQGFAPGILSPTVIIAEGPRIATQRRKLARLQQLLERRPGVAEVVGPADQPAERRFGAALSRDGGAARFFVVFESDPLGARAIGSLRGLQRRMPDLLARAGLTGARTSFAGDTALSAETIQETVDDIGRVTPAAVAAVFVVLAIFLRALVAPLYLVAASALALAASLGVAAYVFQDLLGFGELSYFVPFAAGVLLLSLGSDYNVFLVGGIWQEGRRRPLRQAVRVAGGRAATPITIAGIVLALSFALLWLVPIRSFRELAFIMTFGLVIDAFVVRTLLVPALMTLVGPRSSWPGRLIGAEQGGGPHR